MTSKKNAFIPSVAFCIVFVILLACAPALAAPVAQPPLSDIIKGAKAEGAVSTKLASSMPQDAVPKLEKLIKDKYGVDLKITNTPVVVSSKDVSDAVAEQKAGAPPTYDMMTLPLEMVIRLSAGGGNQKVDWEPLVKAAGIPGGAVLGTPPQVGRLLGLGLAYYTVHTGLLYNPKFVPAAEVPKTYADLANPKWKGRIAIGAPPTIYAKSCYFVGTDKVINDLRAMVKNGIFVDTFANIANRYKLGEVWICLSESNWIAASQSKETPVEFTLIEQKSGKSFYGSLRVGAKHPNAAKLLLLCLASEEGSKFMLANAGAGNLLYTGNYENDIESKARTMKLVDDTESTNDEYLKFLFSEENRKLVERISLVLKGQ